MAFDVARLPRVNTRSATPAMLFVPGMIAKDPLSTNTIYGHMIYMHLLFLSYTSPYWYILPRKMARQSCYSEIGGSYSCQIQHRSVK